MSVSIAAVVGSVGELIARAEAALVAASDTPRLDAELLLAASAGLDRAAVIAHPERRLGREAADGFEAAVARRRAGEPLAYIVGCKEFYSLSLEVSREVLVPRPETERLVEAAFGTLRETDRRALDLGTGSGAIALALKHERPDLEVTAVDRSASALEVARRNARALGLEVYLSQSNWFSALGRQRFDIILSNPPYVPSGDPHFERGIGHEPRIALDGGADGLDAIRAMLREAGEFLEPGGRLLLEHGYDQREAVVEIAAGHALVLTGAHDDLAGRPRVVCFEPESR